jgi:hypothetical protein
MPIFSIAFVLLLSCSVVTPPNLVVVVGGVTEVEDPGGSTQDGHSLEERLQRNRCDSSGGRECFQVE